MTEVEGWKLRLLPNLAGQLLDDKLIACQGDLERAREEAPVEKERKKREREEVHAPCPPPRPARLLDCVALIQIAQSASAARVIKVKEAIVELLTVKKGNALHLESAKLQLLLLDRGMTKEQIKEIGAHLLATWRSV